MEKILIIHPSLSIGGAEKMLCYLANILVEKYCVSVLLLDDKKIDFDIDCNVHVDKLNNYYTDTKKKKNKFILVKNYLKMFRVLKKEIDLIGPDMIIAFDDRVTWIVWLLSFFKRKKIKFVFSQRNDPYDKSDIKNKCFRYIYKYADGVVFQLESVKKFYRLNGNKYKVIPNSVMKINRFISKQSNNIIISAGRFQYRKRFDLLIKAFKIIADKYKNVELVIYGDGEERKNLEKLIDALNLNGRINLPGFASNVMDSNCNALCFVLSSDAEGIPNTLIEAMASGIPSIATDCTPGGANFLLDGGKNGLLVPRGDVDRLAEAMALYIENKELRFEKAHLASRFLESLKPEIINYKWLSFLRDVLQGANNV